MNRFSIKDVEALTGIKSHTLRIWEQRYNITKPKRTATNIRYYDDEDVKILLNVAILNRNGLKISKINKLPKPEMDKLVIEVTEKSECINSQVELLINSMLDLDEMAFEKCLSHNIIRIGFEQTMYEIIFPFLRRVGVLWQVGTINPSFEHFLSNLIRRKIIVAIDALPVPADPKAKKFLLFLPQNELHELSLLFAKYLIRKAGFKTTYLGQNLPINHAQSIYQSTHPDYVLTVLTSPVPGNVQNMVNELGRVFANSRVFISGYQVIQHHVSKPANVTVLREITDLAQLLPALK
jgi:DNA-binding transcriptional MerR regulator